MIESAVVPPVAVELLSDAVGEMTPTGTPATLDPVDAGVGRMGTAVAVGGPPVVVVVIPP